MKLILKILSFLFILSLDHTYASSSYCKNSLEFYLKTNVSMKFCEIPSANGVAIGNTHSKEDEQPVIKRNFKKFHIGQFEVTQSQYMAVMNMAPWKESDGSLTLYREARLSKLSYRFPYIENGKMVD